ncbi:MAG: hypothetical protein ACE5EG_05220, partial [Thermoanaerobaculia bacterium]
MSSLLDVVISPSRPPRGVLLLTAAFAGEPPAVGGLPDELARRLRGLTRRSGWTGEVGQVARAGGQTPVTLFGLGTREEFDERAMAEWLGKALSLAGGELNRRVTVRPPEHEAGRGVEAAAFPGTCTRCDAD